MYVYSAISQIQVDRQIDCAILRVMITTTEIFTFIRRARRARRALLYKSADTTPRRMGKCAERCVFFTVFVFISTTFSAPVAVVHVCCGLRCPYPLRGVRVHCSPRNDTARLALALAENFISSQSLESFLFSMPFGCYCSLSSLPGTSVLV